MFAGVDEDGEPAELRLPSQSRDAARSPEAFWEGSVCLPGSQGNRTHLFVSLHCKWNKISLSCWQVDFLLFMKCFLVSVCLSSILIFHLHPVAVSIFTVYGYRGYSCLHLYCLRLPWLQLSPSLLRTDTVVTAVWHLIGCVLPPQHLPSFPASDWAVAVCRHLGGSAGGSALVAKGTGHGCDISEALRWAEEFACQITKQWCHKHHPQPLLTGRAAQVWRFII